MSYNFKSKQTNVANLNQYMLAKTLSMFEYSNLPLSIPYRELEKMLQVNGYAFFTKVENDYYVFTGGLGGETDVYGNPTTITISNPALNFNKTLDLKTDGVLILNDDMGMGLMPLFNKHHTLLIENDINMVLHGYNTRMQKLISASDDKTKASAESYVKKAIDGDIAVVGENAIFDGVKVSSGNTGQNVSITSMIEYSQYIKATMFNEIGLSANFNMKRERLIDSEIEAGEDSLFAFVYSMMKCRLSAFKEIKKLFGTDINVDFGSVWHFKNKEMVDDVIDPNKVPTEAQSKEKLPDEVDPNKSPSEPETIDQTANQRQELEDILKRDDVSDEDREAAETLLNELENKNA